MVPCNPKIFKNNFILTWNHGKKNWDLVFSPFSAPNLHMWELCSIQILARALALTFFLFRPLLSGVFCARPAEILQKCGAPKFSRPVWLNNVNISKSDHATFLGVPVYPGKRGKWLLKGLLHFAWVVDDAKCIVVTRVCVSVCLSVRGRTPTLLHGPGCNLGAW